MKVIHSGFRKFWWKGFQSMSAVESGLGGTSMFSEDASSKYLCIVQGYSLESWAAELEG